LIELSPGAWNDPVSIHIFIAELAHAPEYDALSYVWGDASKTVPILCNGRNLNVTMNLNAAFKRVRLTYRPRILWADAVCVFLVHRQPLLLRHHRYALTNKIPQRRAITSHSWAMCTSTRKRFLYAWAEIRMAAQKMSQV
jgi:hypothetical protein